MSEIKIHYHGHKVVSRYDDETGESSHTLMEIQKASENVWNECRASGRKAAVAKIIEMPCWNEIMSYPTLAEAIEAAKGLAKSKNTPALKGE
jgi:hypothetical protein